MVLKQLAVHRQWEKDMETELTLTYTSYKNELNMDHRLNCKCKTMGLLGGKKEKKPTIQESTGIQG